MFTLWQFTEGKFGVPDKTDVGMLVWYKDTQINRYIEKLPLEF